VGKKGRRAFESSLKISSHIEKEDILKRGDEYFCSSCKITVQGYEFDITK